MRLETTDKKSVNHVGTWIVVGIHTSLSLEGGPTIRSSHHQNARHQCQKDLKC